MSAAAKKVMRGSGNFKSLPSCYPVFLADLRIPALTADGFSYSEFLHRLIPLRNLRGSSISVRSLNRIVMEAGVLSGVKNPNPKYKGNLTCHLFRHSFARIWKSRGGSIESLSKILGHASTATTNVVRIICRLCRRNITEQSPKNI